MSARTRDFVITEYNRLWHVCTTELLFSEHKILFHDCYLIIFFDDTSAIVEAFYDMYIISLNNLL